MDNLGQQYFLAIGLLVYSDNPFSFAKTIDSISETSRASLVTAESNTLRDYNQNVTKLDNSWAQLTTMRSTSTSSEINPTAPYSEITNLSTFMRILA